MGKRLSSGDFLTQSTFTVVSTATTPRPQPAPQTAAPATATTSPVDPVTVPTTPRRRTGVMHDDQFPGASAGTTRYRVPLDHGTARNPGRNLPRNTGRGTPPSSGPGNRTRDAARPDARPDAGRPRLIAAGIDLVVVLLLIVIFSQLFTVVVDRAVFSGGARQLLVWVVVTVVAWLVCTVTWPGRGGRTPGQWIVSAVPGTNPASRVTDR